MKPQEDLNENARRIAELLKNLGPAAETEIQARTLSPLGPLRETMDDMARKGLVKKRSGVFGKGHGDAYELTPSGLRSLD